MPTVRNMALAGGLAAILSTLVIATTGCASGRVGVGFAVGYPPPPLRAEVYGVRPGLGYVWVPGY